jgi:hypothetical protein
MNKWTCAIAAAGLLLGARALPAMAAEFTWASHVESISPGLDVSGNVVDANRSNPHNALGTPADPAENPGELDFYSLGIGGEMVLSFGKPFTAGDAVVFETTFGNRAIYPESVELLVSTDGISFIHVTDLNNLSADTHLVLSDFIAETGPFHFLKLKDKTDPAPFLAGGFDLKADGFDVNAVGVTAIPLPSATWSALGLLGALGARKRLHRA